MANEQEQAILSQKIGKAAATERDPAKRKELVTTQERNPKLADAESVFNRYQSGRAIQGYRKGGKVKRTGLALVHKGERVLTRKQQSKLKSGGRVGKG